MLKLKFIIFICAFYIFSCIAYAKVWYNNILSTFSQVYFVGKRESLKSDWKKQGEGRGQTYLYARSKKKITWFFKQQIEFFVISYLVVAESFIRRCRHFFKLYLFIWTFKYFCCCYRIYICVRNIAIFYSELTKGRFFSLFHSSIFH